MLIVHLFQIAQKWQHRTTSGVQFVKEVRELGIRDGLWDDQRILSRNIIAGIVGRMREVKKLRYTFIILISNLYFNSGFRAFLCAIDRNISYFVLVARGRKQKETCRK